MYPLVRSVVLSLSIMTYCTISHGEEIFMTLMVPHTDGWVSYGHHGYLLQNNVEAVGAMFPDSGWSLNFK